MSTSTSTEQILVAPIAIGNGASGQAYCLYASEVDLQVADDGGWLTPMVYTNNNDGTFTFTTQSAIFSPQISFTLEGAFTSFLEPPNEYLFTLNPNSYSALAVADAQIAEAINKALFLRFGQAAKAGFGTVLALPATPAPALTVPITSSAFENLYYSQTSWPAQFLLLLEAIVWGVSQEEAGNTSADLQALLGFCTDTLLHYKSNLYNVNRQAPLMGFWYWLPKV